MGLSGRLTAAVGGEVRRPVGKGLYRVADGNSVERRDRVGCALERGDAAVGEGLGVGAWEEFVG
jgi:hypothetical protein